ncbi:MAG: hypothetical protein QG649_696 [Patescibacteria group bacterium]|nr:hypothetical protein [Patescibacteria group bacterium]
MPRPKGSKNKPKPPIVEEFRFTTEQRIKLVANLVVEKIIEDLKFKQQLEVLLENRDVAK